MSRDKLVDAALQQYGLHGYHGATMKKIANDVGIKPASIYFFFENKEKLFVAAFQRLLDNHQKEMERIFNESQEKEVSQICISMIHGLVAHHKGDENGTMAYISLVNTPIPEIKKYLQAHMLNFNEWMIQSFKTLLKSNYASITEVEIDTVVKQYVLLANGVFWSINLFEDGALNDQVRIAEKFIHNIFHELDNKYKS